MVDEEEVDKISFDVEIREDVGAELEEFIRLNHSGNYGEAELLYRECLEQHLKWFPVAAEYADFLLRRCEFAALRTFCRAETAQFTDPQERDVIGLMLIIAELELAPDISFSRSLIATNRVWEYMYLHSNRTKEEPSDSEIHCIELLLQITARVRSIAGLRPWNETSSDDSRWDFRASKKLSEFLEEYDRLDKAGFNYVRKLEDIRPSDFRSLKVTPRYTSMRGISSPWKFYRAWFLFLLEREFFWEAHRILQSFYNIILFRQAILCLERFLIKASQSRDESTSIAVAAATKGFFASLEASYLDSPKSYTWGPDLLCEMAIEGLEHVLILLLEKQKFVLKYDGNMSPEIFADGEEIAVTFDVRMKDSNNKTALRCAVESGKLQIVKLVIHELSKHGKGILKDIINAAEKDDRSVLMIASSNADPNIAALLLDHGAEIGAQDHEGRTALFYATLSNAPETVATLLQRGSYPNNQSTRGETPLICAARHAGAGSVKLLLEHGADFRRQDSAGRTPLSYSVDRDKPEIVIMLLQAGSDVDHRSKIKCTPLMYAIKRGCEQNIKLLLEAKADIELEDEGGRTALSYAADNNMEDVVRLLNSADKRSVLRPEYSSRAPEKGRLATSDDGRPPRETSTHELPYRLSANVQSVSTPEASYVHAHRNKLPCSRCGQTFRGEYELRRHTENKHAAIRKKFRCVDISPKKDFLSSCKFCVAKKEYNAIYNAVAHLRRIHFNPAKHENKSKSEDEDPRTSKGGDVWPSTETLKQWIEEVERYVPENVLEQGDDSIINDSLINSNTDFPKVQLSEDYFSIISHSFKSSTNKVSDKETKEFINQTYEKTLGNGNLKARTDHETSEAITIPKARPFRRTGRSGLPLWTLPSHYPIVRESAPQKNHEGVSSPEICKAKSEREPPDSE